jgi:hypothetical protein
MYLWREKIDSYIVEKSNGQSNNETWKKHGDIFSWRHDNNEKLNNIQTTEMHAVLQYIVNKMSKSVNYIKIYLKKTI